MKKFNLWAKLHFLGEISNFAKKNSIFERNFNFWANYFLKKKKLDLWESFKFWSKIKFESKRKIFRGNFNFWTKLQFLTKIMQKKSKNQNAFYFIRTKNCKKKSWKKLLINEQTIFKVPKIWTKNNVKIVI